jgi:CheY-like chemotaxis protein
MSEEVQRRAFDPFFTTKPLGEGTGLGLSMAYGVVSRLGGTMRLWSEIGKGTRVEVEFPKQAQAEVPEPVAQKAPPTVAGRSILVVEDEPAIRRLTVRMLKKQGYTVTAADGPKQATLCLKSARPDLVLSDLAMPDGGGIEVARSLAEQHPGVPIVFMTGYAPEKDVLPGPVLNKPFRQAQLLRIVDETLRSASAGRPQPQ